MLFRSKMRYISRDAEEAYNKAIKNNHTEELQEIACKDPWYAYLYAKSIRGADIGCCQEWACKDPVYAYYFARDVKGADLEACLEAVKGSWWEDEVRKMVIESGVG